MQGRVEGEASEEDRHWARHTPAVAAGISGHIWTLEGLLCYKL
jgi:hypothetical protein